jgi:Icc protein
VRTKPAVRNLFYTFMQTVRIEDVACREIGRPMDAGQHRAGEFSKYLWHGVCNDPTEHVVGGKFMLDTQDAIGLSWVHFGDLHITDETQANYKDFLEIIDVVNAHLAPHIDFCVLPGDNADDGTPDQFSLVRRGLDRLESPIHIIPGDHDRKPGNLDAFYKTLGAARLPSAVEAGRYRCLFLDVVSTGTGGPDFSLGSAQMQWLERQLESANAAEQTAIVFMHAYPADLKADGERLRRLLRQYRVKVADMGHTHYNELANDGTTIFATTRSTGQIEEGPVGFSIVTLHGGVVTWRFKPLRSPWPLVTITSPADHRLMTDVTQPDQIVSGSFTAIARSWGASPVLRCRCRIDGGPWQSMALQERSNWVLQCEAPATPFTLEVEATDETGSTGTDRILVAAPGYQAPDRIADGSDADALEPWPERHLLGTRLGPNRNGRHW